MSALHKLLGALVATILLCAVSPAVASFVQDDHAPAGQDDHAAQPADDHADDAAHTEDGHAAASPLSPWREGLSAAITAVIVFVIVLVILGKTVWPKITGGLEDRANKIREEIGAAEEARAQAKSALEQYEKALAEGQAEARRMLDEAKQAQQKLAADLRVKADAELARMKERARADIDAAKKTALTEIYTESANLATLVASKILQRELNDSDHKRLLDESLAELQSAES
jgi:F-type H+-transporting ATPase subunit b